MKRARFACLFLLLAATFLLSQSNSIPVINPAASIVPPASASQPDPKAQAKILDSYGKLPLSFEANQGQTDGRVKFLSRTGEYSLFLTADEAVLARRGKQPEKGKGTASAVPVGAKKMRASAPEGAAPVLRMKLRNANPAARVIGMDELAGKSNYFIGNDRTKWRTNVPTYAKVKYEGIYSGIGLVYYGNQRQLEYDFIVAPGADPRRIAFDVRGAQRIRRDTHGELVFKVDEDEIRWHKPVVYQEKDGMRQEIAAHYAITGKNRVGFELGKYDARRPLYIDPLIYSTYLGGSGDDQGVGIAVDNVGCAYVTGYTSSANFPTMNPLQPVNRGTVTAFVTKINPAGSALVYSTYLGGSAGDLGSGIAVDGTGNAYVIGTTYSTDFPTMNALQAAYGGGKGDAFVTKLSPNGSALIYSTYMGASGQDGGYGVAVDSAGNAHITGYTESPDFPITPGAFQTNFGGGNGDAFVAEISLTGTALVYSTYLGGSNFDWANGIATDSSGNAYVTGVTSSTDFPTKNPLQAANGGGFFGYDAFVTKINPSGSALIYSTYLGGSENDLGQGVAVDSAGNAYVVGWTLSGDFPTKNPLQAAFGGSSDAFVAKLDPTGSALVYSTYLGGSADDQGLAIAVDSSGDAYVTGITFSLNFPIADPQKKNDSHSDAFVSKVKTTGARLFFSSYLGGHGEDWGQGIAVDSAGNAYVTGWTESTDFPTKNPLQPANAGGANGSDAFAAKIDVRVLTTTTLSSSPNPSTYGQTVTFTAAVNSIAGAPPDAGTVSFKKGTTVLGTGALSGGSASFMTSTLKVGTNSILAAYSGDSNFAASTSKAVSQVVNKATTTTALTSSLNPSKVGQSVTFTATVTPEFTGKVTGNVSFYDGSMLLKTVSVSGGAAKFTTSTLTSGKHTITATYNGSTNFDGSSASLTQTVN